MLHPRGRQRARRTRSTSTASDWSACQPERLQDPARGRDEHRRVLRRRRAESSGRSIPSSSDVRLWEPVRLPFRARSRCAPWTTRTGPTRTNDGEPSWSFDWRTPSAPARSRPPAHAGAHPRADASPTPTPCVDCAPATFAVPTPTPTPDHRPDRLPGRTPRATEGTPPTIRPNLDLPPTDTAGDYGVTSGDSQGAGQGILFLLAVMAAAGSTYGIRTVRRRAAAKR